MPDSRKRIADGAFLIALMLYILAGVNVVPVHGDEYMQMSMGRDVFYMARGQWDRIAFVPPVQPDTEQFLRLINGSINKTLIGVVWLVSGRDPATLPGIFAWAMPMDWNRERGNIPTDEAIQLARWPSAGLAALGVIPMFLIGWQMRLRSLAYPATLLYALHPVILLNGRRAMMEGSLLLTTLLTVCWLLAMIIGEHSATASGFVRRLSLPVRYAVLGLLVGLAVAAKHTGIVVAGAALVAALVAALARDRSWRPLALVGLAVAIAFLIWFALNPAYWNNPVGAVQAMLNTRADLLQAQTQDAPLAYSEIGQRVGAVIKQSFLTPPQYYESPTWSGLPQVEGQITLYQQSAIDGWDWGPLVGVVLTLLAALGLLALLYDALRRDLVALAILIWAGATIAASLAIPLDWQRYYLPLLLVAIVLAAAGLGRLVVRRTADETRQQTVVDATRA